MTTEPSPKACSLTAFATARGRRPAGAWGLVQGARAKAHLPCATLPSCTRDPPPAARAANVLACSGATCRNGCRSPLARSTACCCAWPAVPRWPPCTTRCPLSSLPCREVFWETTGLNGQSSVREVDVESGKVLRRKDLPAVSAGAGWRAAYAGGAANCGAPQCRAGWHARHARFQAAHAAALHTQPAHAPSPCLQSDFGEGVTRHGDR